MGWDCRSDYGIERADNSIHSMYADNIIPEGSLYVYFTAEVVRHPLLPSQAYEFIETLGRVTDGDGEDIGSISPCGTFYYHEPDKDEDISCFICEGSPDGSGGIAFNWDDSWCHADCVETIRVELKNILEENNEEILINSLNE